MAELDDLKNAALSGDSSDGVDNSAPIDDSSSRETTGGDLSQAEIPENFRKEYGIPDTIRSVADVLKSYKELNSFRGQQGQEVGELRNKYSSLERQYEEMRRMLGGIANGGNKSQEEIDREFLETLSKDPRSGIRMEAERLLQERVSPILSELEAMRGWQKSMQISSEKDSFIRANNLTTEDENALVEIISKDQEYYKQFPSTTHILRAAKVELMEQRQAAASKNTERNQAQNEGKERKATVLSTTNSRPAKQTGEIRTPEEIKEEILASLTK